ncbi:MAG: class I SAM-dependent methyltransferase [Deltaproteobacteria bacterium]|nr:class I SAM-dependent methyltransferase [Deltaproteobacteria bacterium]
MAELLSDALESYIENHTRDVAPLFHELRTETYATMRSPGMQVGRVEGRVLQLLVRLVGARRVLELGMFTGYSALMMAEALPADGELITCDIDPKAEEMARRYFDKSPHGKKIHIRMGPALDTIRSLSGSLDFVFIDADKENYPAYWEALVPKVRQGGLLVADNVLWSGSIIDSADQKPSTVALRRFNEIVQADARVENVLMSVRDGMMVSRKL